MDLLDIGHWAGTEQSYHAYTEAVQRVMADSALVAKHADYGRTSEDRAPRLYSRQGDVAVISVSGSLNNTDSWINLYVGATGYPEIRAAMIHAATVGKQEGVKAIALDIKSGGGMVSGVSDTADLISMIDAKVLPVYAYSDGMIASAAYWIGVAARSLDIGKTTEAGSIGVLMVHVDVSKALEQEGRKATVVRSGKFKALGHPAEALSDLALEVFQSQVDKLNGMFESHVAQRRGKTEQYVGSVMGQGRVFIGQDAIDAGLADSLTNFDAFMSKVRGGIDSAKPQPKYVANSPKGTQVKNALTEQDVAAMLAGGANAATIVAAIATTTSAAAEPAAPVVTAATSAPAPEANADVVALLQTQLAAAQAQTLAASVDLQLAKTAADTATSATEKMRPIVRASVANMRVALGGAKEGVEALNDESLLAEHANLAAQFASKFKVGGVAAAPSSAEAGAVDELAEATRAARIQTIRSANKSK